ncbi:hypothetical protein JYU34_014371 [Plutella xylostella]|uniref:Uncharacterized protein n=1 Tax=Plutella xylostella TaxID=51655 RepID=A0ABQ7Q866_PLUXY|nr:hypothetical protein JYU34_014371 [Plutella xylostella]
MEEKAEEVGPTDSVSDSRYIGENYYGDSSDSPMSSPRFKYNRRRQRHVKHSRKIDYILQKIDSLSRQINPPTVEDQPEGLEYTIDHQASDLTSLYEAAAQSVDMCSDVNIMDVTPVETTPVAMVETQPSASCVNQNIFSATTPNLQSKVPTIKPVIPEELELVNCLQRFGTSNWNNIPFFETQKTHLFTPGYYSLQTNMELKPYDVASNIQRDFENTLAAATHAALTQRKALQERLQSLVDWSTKEGNLTSDSIFEKVKELFTDDSKFTKCGDDILQILCGKRASIIQSRRNNILKQCSNTILAEKIREIPPSSIHLFENEHLNKLLVDNGGTGKHFLKPTFNMNRPDSLPNSKRYVNKSRNIQPNHDKRNVPFQSFRDSNYQREFNHSSYRRFTENCPGPSRPSKRKEEFSSRSTPYDAKRRKFK